MHRKNVIPTVVVLLALLAGQLALAGPISPYYVTSAFTPVGPTNAIYVIQGSAVVNSWTKQDPWETAIALPGRVRTLGYTWPYLGSEYTFAGVFTGVTYPFPAPGLWFTDGTTDGTYNYAVGPTIDWVYRFGTDWSNPTPLFQLTPDRQYVGITYDPTTNSLWVSDVNQAVIENWSLTGTLLFSFASGYNVRALAMDYADGTLWTAGNYYPGWLYHFTRSGVSLGYEYIPGMDDLFWGGEFALPAGPVIPEPSTALLAAAGLAAAAFLRRRRR